MKVNYRELMHLIAKSESFGSSAPGSFDRMVLGLTCRLPDSWLGLRLAILLRRAVTMRLGHPDGALDVERWGMRMRLHPCNNGCEKNLLFTPQMYERVELKELALDIVRSRQQDEPFVFIDIGANVGLFSLFVAAHAGQDAHILAIEPEPENFRRLNFNVSANPNAPIKIVQTALSDESGEVAIAIDLRDHGGTRTRKTVPGETSADTVLVPSQTLMQLLESERIETINALKIDVEGFDDIILNPFFQHSPARMWPRLIIIEDARDSWRVDLMSVMRSKGYVIIARSKLNVILRRQTNDPVN